jgi:hypothetical protein
MAEALTFNIGADTTGFQNGISGLLGKLAGLVAAFISAQQIIEAFGQAIDMGGRLNDLSTRTGETAGNLALLERAFDNTSVGAEKLGPAIAKMQVGITALQTESDACKNAFTQLGLSFADLEGKSPTEQLRLIGERLSGINDPALRAATAVAIFGRAGAELLPVLLNFNSELEGAKAQLGSLPDLLDRNAIQIDALGDNLSAIRNKLTEMAFGFLTEVIPALNMFTEKLAGIDAAGLGAQLAQALVGAFANPMAMVQVLGGQLVIAAKSFGNELIFQVQYWSELMFNTFKSIGISIIPMLGNNMLGAFEMAAGGFGMALYDVIETALVALKPIAEMLGLGNVLDSQVAVVQAMQQGAMDLMADGSARIADSADKFRTAFVDAQDKSTVIRQDFSGVATDMEKVKLLTEGMVEDGKAFADALGIDSSDLAESRTTTGDSVDPAMQLLINEKLVETQSVLAAETKKNTDALKALNAQISTLAGINPNQAIGESADARRVQELDEEIKNLEAAGEDPNSDRMQSLQRAREKAIDRMQGNAPTADQMDAARDAAMDEFIKGDNKKTYQELLDEALDEIMGDPAAKDQEDKQKEQEAAEEEAKKKPESLLSELLNLLRKIEPRIPVPNLQ